jgi:hypothetical protein
MSWFAITRVERIGQYFRAMQWGSLKIQTVRRSGRAVDVEVRYSRIPVDYWTLRLGGLYGARCEV